MRRMTFIALLLCCAPAAAAELDVPVTVAEPRGVARTGWPATGGVPFKPGQVEDVGELALVDGRGGTAPAQFTKLMSWDDGSVQWALVDTTVDVPAMGETRFAVRKGETAAPEHPLEITETDESVTVDTGAIEFVVSKKNFGLFDRVTVGGKPVVTGGSVTLTGGTGVWYERLGRGKWEERVTKTHPGETFAAAEPRRVLWEYKGAVRATLRLDGKYQKDGESWLAYTTRITAWTGSPLVRVEHAVRNSNPEVGADAYISRAALSLELADEFEPQGSGQNWAAGGDGEVGLMTQNWHSAGIYRGPPGYRYEVRRSGWLKDWEPLYKQQATGEQAFVEVISRAPKTGDEHPRRCGALGFTKDGVYALADRAHKESEVWFDFYTGKRDAEANEARAKACRSSLQIRAPGAYVGEVGAMSVGPFGTLADEVAAYKAWGWDGWDDLGKRPTPPSPRHPKGVRGYVQDKDDPTLPTTHLPQAYVAVDPVHEVTEGDALEGYLLMWHRTGMRGYFDWAEAFAGYFRGQAIYRTDWGPRWGTEHGRRPTQYFVDPEKKLVRTRRKPRPLEKGERGTTGQPFGWFSPHCFDWWDARMHACHHYASGLLDYYCLTGNVDAKEAMLDLAVQMEHAYNTRHTEPGKGGYIRRNEARIWITMITAWRATRDPKWKKLADKFAGWVLKAPNWDPEINFFRMSHGRALRKFVSQFTKGHLESDRKFGRMSDLPAELDRYLTKHDIKAVWKKHTLRAQKGAETWPINSLGSTFQTSIFHMAMERHARVFDSEPMKKRVVLFARGVRELLWHDKIGHAIYSGYLGWPEKDMVCSRELWAKSPQISGFATRFCGDIWARAYTFSGDETFLAWGKQAWSRGSRRRFRATKQFAGPDEVGFFATIWGSHHDRCLETCARLFYHLLRAEEE
ncbi:MAG: glycoside hydrolase family 127 protein [Planctomycetota bacterium]